MSTQLPTTLSRDSVADLADRRGEPSWLRSLRLDAFDALSELDLPDVIETPGRRWTDFTDLDFETFLEPTAQPETTVRVSGDDRAQVLPFTKAVDEHETLLRDHLTDVLPATENYLTALSTALFSTGTFVYLPAGVDADTVTIRTDTDAASLFAYTLVVAEESADGTVLQRLDDDTGAETAGYVSNTVEVVANENSHLQYGFLQDLPESTYTYTHKRAVVDTYASMDWIEGNFGGRLTRSDVESELVGDGSESRIIGAFFGHNDQHFDVNARVWHKTAHTTADLVTRGTLGDDARSVYEGVQHVGADAWDTSSYQRERTLMLSETAEADASPKLIINNHDTEASHSATVGQVDPQDLFYMTSRGVEEAAAVDMLVEGFYVPVIEEVEIESFREELTDLVQARLNA